MWPRNGCKKSTTANPRPPLVESSLFVIRYAELALKGGNRHWFEKTLASNLRDHLKNANLTHQVTRRHGRMLVRVEGEADLAIEVLKHIPGIHNFSLASLSDWDLKNQTTLGIELVQQALGGSGEPLTFKVEARRTDKRFPRKSFELAAQLGGHILERFPQLQAKMTAPDLSLGIEIWEQNQAILYLEKIPGQGGLPVGTAGTVISFLSGGIDSPVSSWMMLKRGCKIIYLTFHSFPFTPEESKQKVIDLVERLSRYQPKSILLVVPFAEIQKEIQQKALEKNRTLLYRRMMFRIAERLKETYKVKAYITGEALGQVASQTLENLACTQDAASLPVLRPLVGMDKSEIIEWAKRIGTYNLSIQPFDDCCTVFQPKKPETHGRIEGLRADHALLDEDRLIDQALQGAETYQFFSSIKAKLWG